MKIHMNMLKKAATLLALVFAVGILCGTGITPAEAAAVETNENSAFYTALSQLEGVTSIITIEQKTATFAEKYLVTFTQPIDWNNPEAGTFEQRVEIGYRDENAVNCYQCHGYFFNDKFYAEDAFAYNDGSEPADLTDGNFINIEYRFFGDSVPEGLSNDSTDLWEYLTVENAAKDFKSIIDKLSSILPGRRVFSGISKGGFTTNTMAYYYPDLCDAYVAYVGPLCNGTEDPVFMQNIYETIGDLGYSKEEAAAMRQEMLDFEVLCIMNREELQDTVWENELKAGHTFREFVTKEILYDMTVLNFGIQFWQYGNDFSKISTVLEMPDSTEEEHNEKINAVLKLLQMGEPDTWSTNTVFFPYNVQSAKEMGENLMDFSYLRAAVIEKTGTDMLAVTEEMQDNIFQKMVFTDEQIAAFRYDNTIRNELIEWSETTQAHVIMIYGGCDVWYATRIPDTRNPNVHIYVQKNGNHSALMSTLSEEDKTECIGIFNSWLQ